MLYDNILVPYDGSASADAALEEAARYAKEDPGCALHVLQISDIEHQVIERLDSSYGAAVPVGMREAAIPHLVVRPFQMGDFFAR